MDNEIKFQDNNHTHDKLRKDWDDLEWINEFYEFLKGDIPEGIKIGKHSNPKITPKKAFTIIWYLQEHLRILPDHIEKCSCCNDLYDTHSEGIYWESKGKFYCGTCEDQVPLNYDNNQRD
jgi:hypothetical protein